MPGNVDDVIGAAHDEEVTLGVLISGVRGVVVAVELVEVARVEALLGVPQRRQAARRQRQLDRDRAHLASLDLLAGLVEDMDIVTRHRHGRRTVFDREHAEAQRIACDGPAGLRLPPMVDHGNLEDIFRPFHGIRVGALAGEEQRLEARQVVAREVLRLWIILLDRAERRRRGEKNLDLVFGDHAPESTGVRGADRLAFINNRGAALQQRGIADVGMADDPAHVRRGPIDIAGLDTIKRAHRPVERHHVPAIVAHDALRLAGGA